MSFFDRIFNKFNKKKNGVSVGDLESHPVVLLLSDFLENLIYVSDLNLSFEIEMDEDMSETFIDFSGEDQEMLLDKEGHLLDAIQLFSKRLIQYKLPDEKMLLTTDCDGFRERTDDSLRTLADKLKGVALSKSKPVYFRALSSRDRKIIHQHLAEDGRVQSRSIGEGFYKKIKIFPVKDRSSSETAGNRS